jgi:hypothetical protein
MARLQGIASFLGYTIAAVTGRPGSYCLYKRKRVGAPGSTGNTISTVPGPDGKPAFMTLDQLEAVLVGLKAG